VLEATDGASALAIAQSEPRIDLLFTDVVLPGGMSGRELADALRARLPRLPVLFATGYARDSIADPGALERERGVLGKPYTVEALANGVREAIDRNR
jgi:CheY-like chemotaxis protein